MSSNTTSFEFSHRIQSVTSTRINLYKRGYKNSPTQFSFDEWGLNKNPNTIINCLNPMKIWILIVCLGPADGFNL